MMDQDSVSRRDVVQAVATATTGAVALTTVASAGVGERFDEETRKAQEEFQSDKRVFNETRENLTVLLENLVDRDVRSSAVTSTQSFVKEAQRSVYVAPIEGEGVTHIQMSLDGGSVVLVHQVERDTTRMLVAGGNGKQDVVKVQGGNEVVPLSCFPEDRSCGGTRDCGTDPYRDYYFVPKKRCCYSPDGSESCSWERSDECCTEKER